MGGVNEGSGKREYYEGLPVTSVALLLPVFILIDLYVKPLVTIRIYSVALVLIGIAFISRFKIKKPYMHGLIIIAFLGLVVFLLILKEGDNISNVLASLQYGLWPIFA